jgi:hypothetical protein
VCKIIHYSGQDARFVEDGRSGPSQIITDAAADLAAAMGG